MKKILIVALVALATGTTAFAAPSSKVTDHFASAFKNAKNVTWKEDGRFDKVSFQLGGENVEAFYDVNGELIGTSKTFAFDKLPKSALELITTKYTFPENQLRDCIEFTNGDSEKNYYVSFVKKNNDRFVLKITEGGIVSVFQKSKN